MEYITASNGVEYVMSPLIPAPHAFSTRVGGISRLPHTKGLNLAYGHGDPRETVLANLELLCSAAGVPAEGVVSLPQIHSATVLRVGANERGLGYYRDSKISADGYVTSERGVVPAVKTADCVPVLLCACDDGGRVLSVAAVHAGWRGTSAGIVAEAVRFMTADGARAENIRAAIGPAISVCCYEVGHDFYKAFNPRLRERFVKPDGLSARADMKYHADLKGANLWLLLGAGLRRENIDVSEDCTCCRGELYYSHRASHGVRGSMLSLIAMPEA